MADQCEEEEVRTALQNNNLALAAEKAKEYLEKLNNVPVNIAITGESGSGKSTLVNALRGIKNRAEGAAPTGLGETTMEPTEYIHPEMPNIRIWDLPGIGTVKFTADKYLQHVGFEKYDFFIIVSCDRFTGNDATLAKEIEKIKKKFYFVRSKIDHNIDDEKKEDPNVKKEEVLNRVRNYCTKELQKLGFESPKVFLVSGHKTKLYDFKDLKKTLIENLPKIQREVLQLALPITSLDEIEQKKKILGSRIKWFVLTSSVFAAVPIPGVSTSLDLGMAVTFTTQCQISLGLTTESLRNLSELSRVPFDDLKAELKSNLTAVTITPNFLLSMLTRGAVYLTTALATEEGARFVPLFGFPIAMVVSGVTTYKILNYILNSMAEDAQRVFKKAWGVSTVE